MKHLGVVTLTLVVSACPGASGVDGGVTGGGNAGGTVVAGGTAGGTVVAGGAAGGAVLAGGTAGGTVVAGGSAGGTAGGTVVAGGSAGGTAGGTVAAGGMAGGNVVVAGGAAGGTVVVAGGAAGGTVVAGGAAGGTVVAGGTAGGSVVAGGAAGGSAVDAGPPGIPDGGLRVFVTSTSYFGHLDRHAGVDGGLLGGDLLCESAARAAFLPGSYRAWLSSTGVPANQRVTANGPWYQVSRTRGAQLVFPDRNALTSVPVAGIGYDEFGRDVVNRFFTGTLVGGLSAAENCTNFTSDGFSSGTPPSDTAVVGLTGWTTSNWTNWQARACNSSTLLLCFQNTIDPPAVPLGSAVKLVFVTSTSVRGDLNSDAGVTAGDTICEQRAAAGGLDGGSWVAWLTPRATSAVNRIPVGGGPWYQRQSDGGLVLTFHNREHLRTTPVAPIMFDEFGVATGGTVWTGALTGGGVARGLAPESNCDGFTSRQDAPQKFGGYGDVGSTSLWTASGTSGCAIARQLICFER